LAAAARNWRKKVAIRTRWEEEEERGAAAMGEGKVRRHATISRRRRWW